MNTKSKVTLSIIIFLVVAIGAGLYIRHSFSEKHSDPVESSFSNLSIKNNTTKEFKSVGIAWDDNALMQKTNNYYSLYVLGDGGELGISDKVSKNKTALASWERTENILSSWVHFYGK